MAFDSKEWGSQVKLGSINLAVKDADEALGTFLKMFGTNNIQEVIKLKALVDDTETVDGYYLKMRSLNLGLFKPRESAGRMGKFLQKYGEGIHHIALHLGQDEFEKTYRKFKNQGLRVSEKLLFIGKFSEAVFWLEENEQQEVPVKFATKAYRGLGLWKDTIYLDTPKSFEKVNIDQEYMRPTVKLLTIVVTVKNFEEQKKVWSTILSRHPVDTGDIFTGERAEVVDGRGNIFVPVTYLFPEGGLFPESGRINLYHALNEDAPINKVMARRGVNAMYHNMISYITRDRVHQYWKQLEKAGFAMVDPKPLLNTNRGNGNYFFFVHPISTHGVLCEFVSSIKSDDTGKIVYDWADVETYMIPPEIN